MHLSRRHYGVLESGAILILTAVDWMSAEKLIGPLFLYHPESESSAVLALVNSQLAVNSQAISLPCTSSFCLLNPLTSNRPN